MQYVFSKKVCAVYNGVWSKVPIEGGNFCVKSNPIQSVKLLSTISYSFTEKLGEQYVLLAPPIILLGEQLLPPAGCSPCSPGSPYDVRSQHCRTSEFPVKRSLHRVTLYSACVFYVCVSLYFFLFCSSGHMGHVADAVQVCCPVWEICFRRRLPRRIYLADPCSCREHHLITRP